MPSVIGSRPKCQYPAEVRGAAVANGAMGATLLCLPEGHPCRAFAEGRYRPSRATDDERWEFALFPARRSTACVGPPPCTAPYPMVSWCRRRKKTGTRPSYLVPAFLLFKEVDLPWLIVALR